MVTYVEARARASEAEPLGLASEGASGIAAIVLAIIALADVSTAILAAIATIVIAVGFMAQAFNSAAEGSKMTMAGALAPRTELANAAMVDCLAGVTGIALGILALVGIHSAYLVPAALVVFGGALLLGGIIGMAPTTPLVAAVEGQTPVISYQRSVAAGGLQAMVGIAAVVLGILSLILMSSWVLVLVGFIAVGAALLMVSATFAAAIMQLFGPAR
jgi:hypothetical protein